MLTRQVRLAPNQPPPERPPPFTQDPAMSCAALLLIAKPCAPITGLPPHVHYGNDPDVTGLVQEDNRIREVAG